MSAPAMTREGYARLPEDLLRDLLQGVPEVVQRVQQLLGSAMDRKVQLRDALERLDLIQTHGTAARSTVCGVDGGFAVERTAAVDFVMCVAVGVEGLSDTTTIWDGNQYEWWSQVGPHDIEAERLARGIMVAQELAILADAPHEQRILDGSHLTPVIQINSALSTISEQVGDRARKVWAELDTIGDLARMASDPAVVAMPKYDSSRVITDRLAAYIGEDVPGDDKLLLGLLLNAGELVKPQPVPEDPWCKLHFAARKKQDQALAEALQEAIKPLTERSLNFTYYKPDESSPAFRLELKQDLDDLRINAICSTLQSQMTGPFVREPYPQYLADAMAKSVGLGLSVLQSAAQLGVSGLGRPDIAELLIHSYRTEGV